MIVYLKAVLVNKYFVATRLVNGPNQYSGTVEVFNGNNHRIYGTY